MDIQYDPSLHCEWPTQEWCEMKDRVLESLPETTNMAVTASGEHVVRPPTPPKAHSPDEVKPDFESGSGFINQYYKTSNTAISHTSEDIVQDNMASPDRITDTQRMSDSYPLKTYSQSTIENNCGDNLSAIEEESVKSEVLEEHNDVVTDFLSTQPVYTQCPYDPSLHCEWPTQEWCEMRNKALETLIGNEIMQAGEDPYDPSLHCEWPTQEWCEMRNKALETMIGNEIMQAGEDADEQCHYQLQEKGVQSMETNADDETLQVFSSRTKVKLFQSTSSEGTSEDIEHRQCMSNPALYCEWETKPCDPALDSGSNLGFHHVMNDPLLYHYWYWCERNEEAFKDDDVNTTGVLHRKSIADFVDQTVEISAKKSSEMSVHRGSRNVSSLELRKSSTIQASVSQDQTSEHSEWKTHAFQPERQSESCNNFHHAMNDPLLYHYWYWCERDDDCNSQAEEPRHKVTLDSLEDMTAYRAPPSVMQETGDGVFGESRTYSRHHDDVTEVQGESEPEPYIRELYDDIGVQWSHDSDGVEEDALDDHWYMYMEKLQKEIITDLDTLDNDQEGALGDHWYTQLETLQKEIVQNCEDENQLSTHDTRENLCEPSLRTSSTCFFNKNTVREVLSQKSIDQLQGSERGESAEVIEPSEVIEQKAKSMWFSVPWADTIGRKVEGHYWMCLNSKLDAFPECLETMFQNTTSQASVEDRPTLFWHSKRDANVETTESVMSDAAPVRYESDVSIFSAKALSQVMASQAITSQTVTSELQQRKLTPFADWKFIMNLKN